MSELLNNREQHHIEHSERQSKLHNLFLDLYNGKNVNEVKADFEEQIGTVTVDEVAQLSQLQGDFIKSHSLPEDEIKRLSFLHMSIIEDKIVEVKQPQDEPGHPIQTFYRENREIEKLLQTRLVPNIRRFEEDDSEEARYALIEDCNLMLDVDKHYARKEQLLFPYLEKYGIKGPSTNMWRLDDYIRDALKKGKRQLMDYAGDQSSIVSVLSEAIELIPTMIYREEHILLPMSVEHLTEDEWLKIARESDEIGFCLIDEVPNWDPQRNALNEEALTSGYINLGTGVLSLKQVECILNHLPVDITFIDHNDVVRYFSHGKDRIFARPKSVIGRTVLNCHPPKSAHIVEKLLDDFKAGKKDVEDFWINFRDKYVYVRYFAVRDETGAYLGTLEFTQNIGPIQAIQGEKRILST